MQNNELEKLELLYAIVNHGLGKKIEKMAKNCGAKYTACTYGIGSASLGFLEMIGLADVRKEIVFAVIGSDDAKIFLEKLDEKFKFSRPNHGIAFTLPLLRTIVCDNDFSLGKDTEDVEMSDLITVIVDKGRAEDVICFASKAGAKGGTIMNARGSAGDLPCQKIFAMEIEPEKEIVLIISDADKTDAIVKSVSENMKLAEPNSGILYVQPVKRTLGIQR